MPHSRYLIGSIPFYSVLIMLGVILAIFLAIREEKRLGLPKDTVMDLALWVLPVSILCARIYYVIFSWGTFRGHFWDVFKIWEGGIAIYGAVIGGVITCVVFARRRKLSCLLLMDMIVPGLALAQGIGRWGNFFNMEAYGLPITLPQFQFFPFGVLIPEKGTYVWHLATFFYESVWDFLVFFVLFAVRRKTRKPGHLFAFYLLLYGAGRMVIEGLRMDSLMSLGGGWRVSQVLAGLCVLAAYVWLIFCPVLRKTSSISETLLRVAPGIAGPAVILLLPHESMSLPLLMAAFSALCLVFPVFSMFRSHRFCAVVSLLCMLIFVCLRWICVTRLSPGILQETILLILSALSLSLVSLILYRHMPEESTSCP